MKAIMYCEWSTRLTPILVGPLAIAEVIAVVVVVVAAMREPSLVFRMLAKLAARAESLESWVTSSRAFLGGTSLKRKETAW